MFDTSALENPKLIFERFIEDMKSRCSDFSPLSEDDMRYVFLHGLEESAKTCPKYVRLGHRVYANDRLKMDLVVHTPGIHHFACEFKIQVKSTSLRHAWLILNDLSRLALVSRQWGSSVHHCPSYFLYLHRPETLGFFGANTPRLAALLESAVGTDIAFGFANEFEIKLDRNHNPRSGFRKPPHELEVHSGSARCVARDFVATDDEKQWQLGIYKISGDVYPDY